MAARLLFFLVAALAGSPAAAQAAEPAVAFAREAARICLDTRADPAAVKGLAAAEGWTVADPKRLAVDTRLVVEGKRKKDRREVLRTHAWTFDAAGTAMTVGLIDSPDTPQVRQCELIAWDLGHDAVTAAFAADPRLEAGADQGLPFRMYRVAEPAASVSFMTSDMGSRLVHVVTVHPLR